MLREDFVTRYSTAIPRSILTNRLLRRGLISLDLNASASGSQTKRVDDRVGVA